MSDNVFSPTSLEQTEVDGGIFRAYDIRGIVTTNLTPDMVY